MLLARERTSVLDVVTRLVGLQAQAPRPPFVGLWTRLDGFSRDDLLRLLSARRVVRATAMRCTLHLMTAADYIALRGALQPALTRGMQSVLRDRATALDFPALEAIARAFFANAPGYLRRPAVNAADQVPRRRRARHGLRNPNQRSARAGADRCALGVSGILGFCPGRCLAGKDGPDHGRAGACPGAAISRRVRTGHAGRCAGLVGIARAARGLREPAADAGHVSRRERTRAVRPPGRASSAGRFARARALHPRVRQPRAVARRSHPRPGRRAPARGSC